MIETAALTWPALRTELIAVFDLKVKVKNWLEKLSSDSSWKAWKKIREPRLQWLTVVLWTTCGRNYDLR